MCYVTQMPNLRLSMFSLVTQPKQLEEFGWIAGAIHQRPWDLSEWLRSVLPHSRAAQQGRNGIGMTSFSLKAQQRWYKSNWHQNSISSNKNEVVSVLKAANYLAESLCVTASIHNTITQWDLWLLPLLFQSTHYLFNHLYILLTFLRETFL